MALCLNPGGMCSTVSLGSVMSLESRYSVGRNGVIKLSECRQCRGIVRGYNNLPTFRTLKYRQQNITIGPLESHQNSRVQAEAKE